MRWYALLGLILVSAALLAACSGGGDDGSDVSALRVRVANLEARLAAIDAAAPDTPGGGRDAFETGALETSGDLPATLSERLRVLDERLGGVEGAPPSPFAGLTRVEVARSVQDNVLDALVPVFSRVSVLELRVDALVEGRYIFRGQPPALDEGLD